MYNKIITDPKFYSLLFKYDEDLAAKCFAEPCFHCGDKLNQAHYTRKPRGGSMTPEEAKRFSYCCRAVGC